MREMNRNLCYIKPDWSATPNPAVAPIKTMSDCKSFIFAKKSFFLKLDFDIDFFVNEALGSDYLIL